MKILLIARCLLLALRHITTLFHHLIISSSHHLILTSPHHLITFALFFFLSCNNSTTTGVIQNSSTKTEETDPFVLGNKKIVELENEEIDLIIKHYQWKMTQTNTGLRYEITKKGVGKNIEKGETVFLEYSMMLLNGEKVYNSKEEGVKKFVVEKSEEIAALHEAVQLMNKGAEARLIIPSHLAYGVSGDGNKIMPYQTLIMKVKIK